MLPVYPACLGFPPNCTDRGGDSWGGGDNFWVKIGASGLVVAGSKASNEGREQTPCWSPISQEPFQKPARQQVRSPAGFDGSGCRSGDSLQGEEKPVGDIGVFQALLGPHVLAYLH